MSTVHDAAAMGDSMAGLSAVAWSRDIGAVSVFLEGSRSSRRTSGLVENRFGGVDARHFRHVNRAW